MGKPKKEAMQLAPRRSLPTGSQIGRVMACIFSWLLVRFDRAVGAAAIAGTQAHDELFQTIEHGAPSPWDMGALLAWLVADGGKPKGELALAYDAKADTAKALGQNIGREYAKHGADPFSQFCLSLDAVAIQGSRARLLDLKTGRSEGDPWQLKLGAVALARAFDLDEVIACFWYRDSSGLGIDRLMEWRWGSMDLAGFAEELNQLQLTLEGAPPAMGAKEGEHCTYCHSFAACPAKMNLARSLVAEATAPGVTMGAEFTALTPAEAGLAWERLIQAEALVKHIRTGLEGYATQQPIQLSDGRQVRAVEAQRESILGPVAYAVLAQAFNVETAESCCPPATSKAAITDALGKEEGARALELIGAAGGIQVKTFQQVKALKPPKAPKDL